MQNALAVLDRDSAIEGVKVLASIVRTLRESVFVKDADYGVIPGTGDKPVLLLPGMEKLMRALRLRAEYVERQKEIDFAAGLFYFEYECRLIDYDTGICVATAIGSANSYESKWRWRDAKRICPNCGKDTINKSRFSPKSNPDAEPGWYCYTKIGGCGKEYAVDDDSITSQTVGRIENPDIADQLNTICKIGQKRALASAIKGAANVSEFFTVDLDDLPLFPQVRVSVPENVVDGTFVEEDSVRQDRQKPVSPGTKTQTKWTVQGTKDFLARWQDQGVSLDTLKLVLRATKGWGDLKANYAFVEDAQAEMEHWLLQQPDDGAESDLAF